jgi:hypothetical protein
MATSIDFRAVVYVLRASIDHRLACLTKEHLVVAMSFDTKLQPLQHLRICIISYPDCLSNQALFAKQSRKDIPE